MISEIWSLGKDSGRSKEQMFTTNVPYSQDKISKKQILSLTAVSMPMCYEVK